MCEGDSDEQCEGPGLPLVLVFTFIFAMLFLAVAATMEQLSKSKEAAIEHIEMEEYNTSVEWHISNFWINLSVFKKNLDFKNAAMLATTYYENATLPNNGVCPKDEHFMMYLGTNKLSAFFYDCVDGAISVRVISFLNNHLPIIFQLRKKFYVEVIKEISECIMSLTLRYSDLPKDILLLYIIWIQLVSTHSGMFSMSIFWILAVSILASEVMHIFTILINNGLDKERSVNQRLYNMLLCPLMPAIYLFKHYKLKLSKDKLLNKLAKDCNNRQKQAHQKLKELDYEMQQLELMSAKLHCNENVVENLTQLIILVMFILLSYTNSITVERIDYMFIKKNTYITVTLASMSFTSILRGQLNLLKANKNGCLSLTGTVIAIPYFLIGTAARYVIPIHCLIGQPPIYELQ